MKCAMATWDYKYKINYFAETDANYFERSKTDYFCARYMVFSFLAH